MLLYSVELLRRLTKLALDTIGDAGFALAGAGAIREHGLLNRSTRDIDLFTTRVDLLTSFQALLTRSSVYMKRKGSVLPYITGRLNLHDWR